MVELYTLREEVREVQDILCRIALAVLPEHSNPQRKFPQTERTYPSVAGTNIQAHRLTYEIYFKY